MPQPGPWRHVRARARARHRVARGTRLTALDHRRPPRHHGPAAGVLQEVQFVAGDPRVTGDRDPTLDSADAIAQRDLVGARDTQLYALRRQSLRQRVQLRAHFPLEHRDSDVSPEA